MVQMIQNIEQGEEPILLKGNQFLYILQPSLLNSILITGIIILRQMMGNSFEGFASHLKRAFDEYVGFPYLVILCLFYCIFAPSPFWLSLAIAAKIILKVLWEKAKLLMVCWMLQKICNRHLSKLIKGNTFNRSSIEKALEGTQFDKNHLRIFPDAKEAVFMLVKLKEYALALNLIYELEENSKKQDQELAIIKQFANSFSQNQGHKDINKDALLARDNLEKFIIDVSHNKLNAVDGGARNEAIPKQWIEDLGKLAYSNKADIHKTAKQIKKVANNQDRISNADPTIPIPENSLHFFYNLFANSLKFPESNRGLYNLGNTCYMNSALQCLHKTFELTSNMKRIQPLSSRFAQSYLQLIEELTSNDSSPFRPREIKKLIGKYNPIFDDNNQHDAGELLSTVLNYLNEDLNTVSCMRMYKIDPSIIRSDDELLQEYVKRDRLRSHSVIEELFFGWFLTTYQCRQCGGSLKLFEKFNTLFLPVSSRGEQNLTACMREFVLPERMEGQNAWWCSACEDDTPTDKFMSVYQHSPVLVVCLKRFTETSKITSLIDFDRQITLQHLSSNPHTQRATYDLYGVINHVGSSLHQGHYYSFCLDRATWRKYDDSSVREISESEVVTANAFVLLYRLRGE